MSSVLYVSSIEINTELTKVLKSVGYDSILHAKSSSEARRMISSTDYALILINTPLQDENGIDLAWFASSSSVASVALIVKSEFIERVEYQVAEFGVVVIQKPISPEYLYRNLKILYSTQNRIIKLVKDNRKLEEKVAELKLVDRAKCLLIAKEKMEEELAHRFIEKTAMDKRISRKEVALKIIDKYTK